MSNTVTLETKFVVPDDVGEENVRSILNEFFGDLIETDRFIDAKITDEEYMSDADKDGLLALLESVDDEQIDDVSDFIDEHTAEESSES